MTVLDIIRQAYIEINEDPDYPMFWSMEEVLQYVFEGLRIVLEETKINITERAIPLYAQVLEYDNENNPIFESFSGYYVPPIEDVQTISNLFWKEEVVEGATTPPAIREIEIKTLEQMDRIDPTWRTATDKYPRYAVVFSGNYNEMNMQTEPLRNRLKIKFYPTPDDMDVELQTALYSIQGDFNNVDSIVVNSQFGGLANNGGPGIVWGLDTDGDGEPDNGVIEGSTETGIMTDVQQGNFDISEYGNYPFIRYVPEVDKRLLYSQSDGVVEYNNLNSFLPLELQLALREYMAHRCFRKEGEAQDREKSQMYYELFENMVIKYKARNMIYDDVRITPDVNYSYGAVNNGVPGSYRNNRYNTLRL